MMHNALHRITGGIRPRQRAGFTLLELMVVIGIILILIGLLFPAINKAFDTGRMAATMAEIKNLDSAMRHYYSTYERWPNTMPFIPNPEDIPVSVEGDFAEMLQGLGNDPNGNNPRKTRFVEFSRFDANGDPVNAWGKKGMKSTPQELRYHLKFDTDYDNIIRGTGDPDDPPEKDIKSPVIVWTFSKKGVLLGSWM
jgi:prepilin-type N-terminal cleavage/methylation domain-containing protein